MELEIVLPRRHWGQDEVLAEAKRWNVLACGRRWGKTVLGRELAVRSLLLGQSVAWGAPQYKFLGESFRSLRKVLEPLIVRASESEHRIEVLGGGSIDFWTLGDVNAGRGYRYSRWILDEAAMVEGLGDVFMEAVRPSLSDFGGDAWFLSTPKGRDFFWEAFELGRVDGSSEWKSWQRPSHENLKLSRAEIESARRMLPELSFRQEYLAEFLDGEDTVFRGVRDCVDVGRADGGLRVDGREYQVGVDLARIHDYTVISVVDDLGVQVWFERVKGMSWENQVALVARICKQFGALAVVDSTGVGDVVVEQLNSAGVEVVPFRFTRVSKRLLMERLAWRLDERSLRLMDVQVQTQELEGFAFDDSGRMRARGSGFDDCVCALALSVWPVNRARLEVY